MVDVVNGNSGLVVPLSDTSFKGLLVDTNSLITWAQAGALDLAFQSGRTLLVPAAIESEFLRPKTTDQSVLDALPARQKWFDDNVVSGRILSTTVVPTTVAPPKDPTKPFVDLGEREIVATAADYGSNGWDVRIVSDDREYFTAADRGESPLAGPPLPGNAGFVMGSLAFAGALVTQGGLTASEYFQATSALTMTGRLSNAAEQQYSLLPGLTYGWAGSGTGSFSTFSLSPAGVTVRDPTGLELISGDGSTLFRLDDDGTANTVIHRHGQPSFWRARSDGGFELLDESGNVVRLASVDAEGWYSFVSLDPTTGTQIAYERDLVVVPGVIISERSDGFAVLGGTTNTSLTFGGLTQNFGNLGNYAFSQVDLQQSDKFVRQLVWSNLQTGGPALTVDVAYDPVTNAVQSATITDNANNFDWSRQDVREVFSNPGSATSSGITVTSTQLDGGERVITLERDAGVTTNDVNNDGVVDQEDADIIFGSGGDDTSGGEGLDILEGGAGQDQLNSDGSKTRYTVTGWRPEVTAGYTFNDVVNNFGEIKVFGEDKVDLTAPILIGSSEGRFGFGDLSEQAKC